MHIDRLIITRTLSCLLTFLALACGGKSTGVDEDFIESDASVDKGDAEVDEGDFTGCGDGILDPENDEQCDGDNLGYATCLSIGYGPGILVCNDACYFDITGCGEPQEDELGETGLPGISIWDWLNQDTETGQNEDSDNNPFTDWFGGNDDSGFFGNSDRGGLFGNDDSGFFGNSDRGGLFGNDDGGFFGNSDRGGLFGNNDSGFFGNSDR
ncbi:MAG: hypothetical protein JXA30_21905, partial [Deltaproteobacteria bacterium]|nr:hypothetical protein [Deltaproteobacteria bacterium]